MSSVALRGNLVRRRDFEVCVGLRRSPKGVSAQHRNPTARPEWFTTAYFHRPEELSEEIAGAALDVRQLLAVEGPAWLLGNLEEWLRSEKDTQLLLSWLRRIEAEPSMLGASAHLLAVAQKV